MAAGATRAFVIRRRLLHEDAAFRPAYIGADVRAAFFAWAGSLLLSQCCPDIIKQVGPPGTVTMKVQVPPGDEKTSYR